MNQALELLAREVSLLNPENEHARLAYGYACVARVRHLLEEAEVAQCLDTLLGYLEGRVAQAEFTMAQHEAERLANHHKGSKSIDGCGHASVSASYAVANAIKGKALQAADYAAYAAVYAEGGYGAVSEPESFEREFAWQVSALQIFRHGMTNDGTNEIVANTTLKAVHMDTSARKSCAFEEAVLLKVRPFPPA